MSLPPPQETQRSIPPNGGDASEPRLGTAEEAGRGGLDVAAGDLAADAAEPWRLGWKGGWFWVWVGDGFWMD